MNRIGKMRECTERIIPVGFMRDPKSIFDEVEKISAEMIRQGWKLHDSHIEESLGNIHLFFERSITIDIQ
jgi:hypothetical protein